MALAEDGAAVLFVADAAAPLSESTLGAMAERRALHGFPSTSTGADAVASAALPAAVAPPAAAASDLRRLAFEFSSTPRTRAAKVREQMVSDASAASGDACARRVSEGRKGRRG